MESLLERKPAEGTLESVDLVLAIIEMLALDATPRGVTEVARALSISKARAHRHLRALVSGGYVRQDPQTERYAVTAKLMRLGEAVRDRFDLLPALRPSMTTLRNATGQAVTAAAPMDDALIVLELLHGRTLIEFGIRPGAALDLHASAHGLVALAFGPATLMQRTLEKPLKSWTTATVIDSAALRSAVDTVREQGWATAPDQVMIGVNALAAPVFDDLGAWRGSMALVGSTQFIPAIPEPRQIEAVTSATRDASRRLGWRS